MNAHENKVEKSSEVPEKARRRRYTREYKERIIAEADLCVEPGQLGSLMRREGLYSSCIPRWRKQLQEQELGTSKRKAARNRNPSDAQQLAKLKRENERLTEQLRQAQLIIEVQKKVSEMMQTKSPEKDD